MNSFRTFGVALVVGLSLLLNGIACVLIAVSMRQQTPTGDADVVVAGVGNSGNSFGGGASARRLARHAAERGVTPPIDDATLRAAVEGLVMRAKQGDVEAASFVFELAAAQRAKSAPTTTESTGAGR